jgi:hypothetical protein
MRTRFTAIIFFQFQKNNYIQMNGICKSHVLPVYSSGNLEAEGRGWGRVREKG